METRKRTRLGGLLVAALAIGFVLAMGWGHAGAGTSLAGQPPDGIISVDCDTSQAGVQNACAFDPGTKFDVDIFIVEANSLGYIGYQANLSWEGAVVNYQATASTADEVLGPACTIPARAPDPPTGDPPLLFGCAAFPAPDPALTTTGAVLRFEFQCKAAPMGSSPAGLDPNQSEIHLISDPGNPQGTNFTGPSAQQIEPTLNDAIITCAVQPTPTTAAPTATTPPSDAPTATPMPPLPEGSDVTATAADGTIATGETTDVTIVVTDPDGNPLVNQSCTVAISSQPGDDATLSLGDAVQVSGDGFIDTTTDENGEITVTLGAGSTAGTIEVAALCGDITAVASVTVGPEGLPVTGASLLDSEGGVNAGLWVVIGVLFAAVATTLTGLAWRRGRAH